MVWALISGEAHADHESQDKRSLLILAVVLCVILATLPRVALADEEVIEPVTREEQTETKESYGSYLEEYDKQLKELQDKLDSYNSSLVVEDAVNKARNDEVVKELGEISKKLSDLEKLDKTNDNLLEVRDQIKNVSTKVDALLMENAEPEIKATKELNSKAAQTFTVYSNVSPTGQYATYAKQIVPKMGWDDDYIYFQDTSSSYVLVYGPLQLYSAGTVTGTQCEYVRWYYSGTSTGYLVQSGSGDVTINLGGYEVLSSLGQYPLLDDGFTLYRQEVCFYAVVAVVVYSLYHVWGFLIRLRR